MLLLPVLPPGQVPALIDINAPKALWEDISWDGFVLKPMSLEQLIVRLVELIEGHGSIVGDGLLDVAPAL